jgi:WD domain, G-beta repeat
MLVLSHVKQSIDALAFSPDGRLLAAGGTSEKAGVQFWNISTQTRIDHEPLVSGAVSRLWWTGHENPLLVVATSGYGVYVLIRIDDDELELLCQHANVLAGVSHRNFAYLSKSSADRSERLLFKASIDEEGQFTHTWGTKLHTLGWANHAVEIHGGKELLTTEFDFTGNHRGIEKLIIRSTQSGLQLTRLPYPELDVAKIAASSDGMMFCAAKRASLVVWSAADDRPRLAELKNDGRKFFTALAFHPSGRYLAATSNDATVKLYDTTTWELARTFTWDIGRMRSIAFSPDGTLAAAGSATGRIIVWDLDF